MKALTFNVQLLEPLLVNDVGGGDPNSAVGFEFIPGSVIKGGALIGKYLRGKPKNSVDAEDSEFRKLFFDGETLFLNGYPLNKDGSRSLPTPLSWHFEKDDPKKRIHDLTSEDYLSEEMNFSERNWKKVTEPFCNLFEDDEGEETTILYQPLNQVQIHIFRANRQKETDKESTIFRYQALEAGQNFSCVILVKNESSFEKIKGLLEERGNFNFGKSHLAGYGRVRVYSIKVSDDWEEYSAVGDEDDDKVVITLLSDAIIRDKNTGAYCTNINSVLGMKSGSSNFVGTRVRGGFNRTWNLPLPQVLAIKAGSVFVYKINSELLNLLETQNHGGDRGEKREEGYGRIAVNWHRVNEINTLEDSLKLPSFTKIEDPDSLCLAKRIVERMTKEKLDQALIQAANVLEIKENAPKKSQLSRMRVIVRRSLKEDDLSKVTEHISKMKEAAEKQFQNARIENKSLKQWITELIENPHIVWETLQTREEMPSLGEIKPEFSDELAREYAARLIDSVLHKAYKEAKDE